MEKALAFAESNFEQFVSELEDLLRIPSISTDPAHRSDVRAAAAWLVDHLKSIGIERAEIMETGGHPVVYGEHLTQADRPTILVYGHYDVQPPDPLDLWESPPFEPVRKNGTLYARGTYDDAGQLFMHVNAAESFMKAADG